MASIPNAIATAKDVTTKVGAMIPLGQISSVVQTLQNIQGFNPGAFSQLTGTIQSALTGFTQASSILQAFSGQSPLSAFTNALSATGLAGSSISQIAGAAASAYQQADSFLNTVSAAQSWQQLNSQRPSVEEAREANLVGGGLQFPKDIGKYWIYLGFEEANFGTIMGSSTAVYQRKGTGSVTLPIPMNLTDTNQLAYQPLSLTDQATSALSGAASVVSGFAGVKNMAAGLASKIGVDKLGDLGGAGVIASAAAESAGALLGYALNTHQTLKFVQPTLKTHSLSWKLVPSSKEESEALHTIIRYIKSRIYPTTAAGGLAFQYPNLVNVYMYNGDKMYFFKPAYVQGFAVNYTTEGGPAYHKDEYPVSVQIDMTITETAVWLSTDRF